MSTMHSQPEVDTENEIHKPFAILDYNGTTGAVDSFDQQISCYSCARKSNRWPMRQFYFIIDCASVWRPPYWIFHFQFRPASPTSAVDMPDPKNVKVAAEILDLASIETKIH